MTTLTLPEFCLVVLVGPSGCGKSTFARRHFKPTEVLSSDFFRALVSDDESNQQVSGDAFDLLHYTAAKRLAHMRLTVIDATNVQSDLRQPLLDLARRHYCQPVAIVFDLPESVCHDRNRQRAERQVAGRIIHHQWQNLKRSTAALRDEGFRAVHILTTPEEVDAVTIIREPLRCNRTQERGPFDIVGDVHGCCDELISLLTRLGYEVAPDLSVRPPAGRKVVFVGDLVDRGPRTPDVMRLVMGMVEAGTALCVPGNHDDKLLRKLRGRDVQIAHGLAESLAQLDREPPEFKDRIADFIDGLVSHYVLDGGSLVVAHAGMKQKMQGRTTKRVRDFALFGETTGETDEFGLPVRHNWAAEYRGEATVVYGHTPIPEPEWLNRTINIDTGCVFGGKLTALRWPERELVSVPASQQYAVPRRPFLPAADEPARLTAQQTHDDVLDLADVLGRRTIQTGLMGGVTIREENAAAALEVMSRFATNPRWLIYLPPTMSPPETSTETGFLEHPAEAFAYYRREGVERLVCQEKHMGSRAVVVVCRDEEAARQRFGVVGEGVGVCYTRTGRRFFDDNDLEQMFLDRVRGAVERAGLFERLNTSWVCLDCELMPWSAKAQELLRQQYAAVGSSSRAALAEANAALGRAVEGNESVRPLLERFRAKEDAAGRFTEAYRGYCWPVRAVGDLRLAPFHLLASEGMVHEGKDHVWHMERAAELARADGGMVIATAYRVVEDAAGAEAATRWWLELTERGGEGMVVKPMSFVARGRRGLAQPAMKCRGREYLRIIYGPDYDAAENLDRLRQRNVSSKRLLALREFALGLEGLTRFVRREPLRAVHECSFGVLALESEPVDPRL